ncbi:hypothetical protein GGR54DRAFT_594679 [Hypoxylon sp. NC1633]|nr:hypothetical protein GGR54DRAFT_594679 [Hypoxylon sp. NC1633]
MSYDVIRLREEIERGIEQYGLCPNRIWQVGSQLFSWENDLCGPFEASSRTFSHVLSAAMEHEDHSSCTFEYCEFSSRNFTAVQQYHEPGPSDDHDQEEIRKRHKNNLFCFPFKGHFREDVLLQAVNLKLSTAWAFDGETILKGPRPYMTISHVWPDETGAGPWGSGHVNECIYEYFKKVADKFDCEGIWWDTICIPQDNVARRKALSAMHLNYQYARITLVHDRFLRGLPFVDPQMASMAIILSSWFTRGWTALELAQSRKVKVMFKDAIKDLDEDILNKAGDSIAAEMIRGLRNGNVSGIEDLLRTLGPSYTSWLKERAVIAGLLTGIDTLQPPTRETFQRDIYQNIIRRIKKISF